MTLGQKDKLVILAFIDHRALAGLKLSTDGKRLDGHWMGGSRIAERVAEPGHGGYIQVNDLGSRAAQTVQRAVRKYARVHRVRVVDNGGER